MRTYTYLNPDLNNNEQGRTDLNSDDDEPQIWRRRQDLGDGDSSLNILDNGSSSQQIVATVTAVTAGKTILTNGYLDLGFILTTTKPLNLMKKTQKFET